MGSRLEFSMAEHSALLQSGFGWAFVAGWPSFIVACVLGRIAENYYIVDPRGGEKYWLIGEDGKVMAAEPRRYRSKELERLFVTMPKLALGVGFGDGTYLYRANFQVVFLNEVDRDAAVAFCNWYRAIPTEYHNPNDLWQYLRDSQDNPKLPFKVVLSGQPAVA